MVGRNLKTVRTCRGSNPVLRVRSPKGYPLPHKSTTYSFVFPLFTIIGHAARGGQLSELFQHRGICCAHERVKNRLNRTYFYGGRKEARIEEIFRLKIIIYLC